MRVKVPSEINGQKFLYLRKSGGALLGIVQCSFITWQRDSYRDSAATVTHSHRLWSNSYKQLSNRN